MRIVVAGIPGAGKTTVLNEALKIRKMDVINYGDVMFEMARQDGIKDRDEMRKMPQEKQKEWQIKAAEKIGKMEHVIIDTHSTIKTPYGYLPGLPYHILQIIKPDRIILVEADAEEIFARRKKDEGIRQRDEEGKEEIETHQMMNRIAAMSYAVLAGATVKIVHNRQGMLEEAAREIAAVLE